MFSERRLKNRNAGRRARKHCRDYCSHSTIHGLSYLGEDGRPLLEKFCWTACFTLSIVACAILIHKVWVKWDESPVIVTFAETTTPVWDFPFPAVTICSETKSRQTVFNFTEAIMITENLTDSELQKLSYVALVCQDQFTAGNLTTNGEDVFEFIEKVAPPFDETVWFARYYNSLTNKTEMFQPVFTEEGICWTFNLMDQRHIFTDDTRLYNVPDEAQTPQDWSLDEGFRKDSGAHTQPRRALGAGATAGLTILLRAYSQDLDYLCRGAVQGYKVALHNPGELPRISQQYFRMSLNQELIMSVRPNMVTTSGGLRSYSPKRRQCYFPSERRLRFFREYTQNKCVLECLTNFTLGYCGCVALHMPHEDNTPLCGAGSKKCLANATEQMLQQQISHDSDKEVACDCLPGCITLEYEAETSSADFDGLALLRAYTVNFSSPEFLGLNVGRINIFVKEMQFITSRRSELYGPTDFIANCGGLLGLFTGCSILSLVELVYFFTVRLCCTLRHKVTKEDVEPEKIF